MSRYHPFVLTFLITLIPSISSLSCTLQLPPHALTAKGMSTPWILGSSNIATPCRQGDTAASTFVHGTILNLDTHEFTVYNPLIITQRTSPAIPPTIPTLPTNYIIAYWIASTAQFTLIDDGSYQHANCVMGGGVPYSTFRYFAACNTAAFWDAYDLIAPSLMATLSTSTPAIPPPGKGADDISCPTAQTYWIYDGASTSGVTTTYIITSDGRTAQNTKLNRDTLATNTSITTSIITHPQGHGLLVNHIDIALGCQPWIVRDLADPTGQTKSSSVALNIIQSHAYDTSYLRIPAGAISVINPSITNTLLQREGGYDINKVNAMRQIYDQQIATSPSSYDTSTYCQHWYQNITSLLSPTIQSRLRSQSSPISTYRTLFDLIIDRINQGTTFEQMACQQLINMPSPFANYVINSTNTYTVDTRITTAIAALTPVTIVDINPYASLPCPPITWSDSFEWRSLVIGLAVGIVLVLLITCIACCWATPDPDWTREKHKL